MKKILILSGFEDERNRYGNDLINLFSEDKKIKVTVNSLVEISIKIKNNILQIFDLEGIDIKEYSFVYFFTHGKYLSLAFIVAQYLKKNNIKFIDSEKGNMYSVNKLNDFVVLLNNNIPIIDTIYASSKYLLSHFDKKPEYKYPFIIKDISGRKGNYNYLIKNYEELKHTINSTPEVFYMVQPFIPNDCDYRILTFDFKAKLIIKRTRQNDLTHLNNTSAGAKAEIIPIKLFNNKILKIAQKSAKVLKRNIAGVDVIIKSNGEFYILEVNNSPQLLSGTFLEEKKRILREFLLSK